VSGSAPVCPSAFADEPSIYRRADSRTTFLIAMRAHLVLLLTCLVSPLGAQTPRAQTHAATDGSLALKMLGASLGSAAGIGVVLAASNCGSDDLGCGILSTGGAGVLGIVGAALGATLVASHTGAPRSVGGAIAGGLVGTGVGLGVHYLLDRNSDRNLGDPVTIPIFAISQGVFAALGSRLIGRSGH
jgi:hypothetical protein